MRLKWIFLLFLFATIGLPTLAQSQDLPAASWYGVVWVRGDDTLHWISPNGEPASIPRPTLPDESQTPNPQMRFSRDGRFMLLVAEIADGTTGIGIYDIQAGQFTKTHQAQPDENIYLGRTNTSNLSATSMAVGLASRDFDDDQWRIIVFDLASGDPSAVLNYDTASWEMDIPPSIPVITYFDVDEGIGQEVVHFQMVPKAETPTSTVPAFKWYPSIDPPNDMGLSAYDDLDADINYINGEIVTAYANSDFSSLPEPESGLNFNTIGRGIPAIEDVEPTRIWVDDNRYLYTPIWANGTDWVVFFSETTIEGVIAGWQIIDSDGALEEKIITPMPASTREVMGTPNGLLVINVENRISHITSLTDIEGTLLFESPEGQLAQIVFVSREPDVFTLASVGTPTNTVALAESPDSDGEQTPITVEPEALCEGTLPSILSIGATARVANTDGIPLRVRETPGGAVVTEINEGTEYVVVDGPECLNSFAWWQIQFNNASGNPMIGWAAEGDSEDYWVEVLSSPASAPTATPEPTKAPVEQPTVATTPTVESSTDVMTEDGATPADTTGAGDATAIPVGDGDCSAAPESRIQVGMNVLVQAAGGTLAFRANPLDPAPVAQLADQATLPVIGGPACRGGYRQWQVRITLDGSLRDGWVSEGTITRYFLEPIS